MKSSINPLCVVLNIFVNFIMCYLNCVFFLFYKFAFIIFFIYLLFKILNGVSPYNSSGTIFSKAIFFLATFEMSTSIGFVVSYNDGAFRIIMPVPMIQANVNIQRKRRSSTIATYFQSSSTLKQRKKK